MNKEITYTPLVIGIILVGLSLYSIIFLQIRSENSLLINFAINAIVRMGIAFWTVELVRDYNLKGKYLWIVLGLLLAGWQLIAINIAILIKKDQN